MNKTQALLELMDLRPEELQKLELEQLRDILGALRYVTRVVEREVNQREIQSGLYRS